MEYTEIYIKASDNNILDWDARLNGAMRTNGFNFDLHTFKFGGLSLFYIIN